MKCLTGRCVVDARMASATRSCQCNFLESSWRVLALVAVALQPGQCSSTSRLQLTGTGLPSPSTSDTEVVSSSIRAHSANERRCVAANNIWHRTPTQFRLLYTLLLLDSCQLYCYTSSSCIKSGTRCALCVWEQAARLSARTSSA